MKTFRIICFITCIILLGIHICDINYNDLSFSANKGHFIDIVTMTLLALSFLMGIIKDRKKE